MPTKTLEMNMAMLAVVGFQLVVDILERNPSSSLHLLSFPAGTRSHKPPPPITSFQVLRSFRSSPSLSRSACSPSSLLIFVLSSSSHLAGNPISSPHFRHPKALADICSDIGLFYYSQPRFAPCLHSLRRSIRCILVPLGIQSPFDGSITRGPSLMFASPLTHLPLPLGDLGSLLDDVRLRLSASPLASGYPSTCFLSPRLSQQGCSPALPRVPKMI